MKKIKKIKISHHCIGCGACEAQCKAVFRIVPRAQSQVVNKDFETHEKGVINAFKACPVQGIEILSDDPSLQTLWRSATIIEKTMLTETVVEIKIRSTAFDFKPGQYVTLRYVDFEGPCSRAYSVVAVDGDVTTLAITLLPDGRGSTFLEQCETPCGIMMTEPRGEFFMQETDNPKVFVATGTGVAPMISMIEASPHTKKVLYFGVRKEKDIFYMDRLKEAANLDVKICLDFADDDWTGNRGRVTEFFEKDPLEPETEIYTCGSEPMMQGVEEILKNKKHSPDSFYRESFTAALPTQTEGNTRLRIWMRHIHVYSSLALCTLFLFFGLTGFMANRPKLFGSEESNVLPENIELKKDDLTGYMKTYLPEAHTLKEFVDEDGIVTLTFDADSGGTFVAEISSEDRTFSVTENRPLPASATMQDNVKLAEQLAKTLEGSLDRDAIEGDDEFVNFTLSSVWSDTNVDVDKAEKVYTISKLDSPWVTALTNLHRGKNASPLQKLFIDASGIIMVLVTLTGMIFAVQSRLMRTRVVAGFLIAVSIVLAVLMLIKR